MKLKNIELDGFGKFVNQTFEFGPGLNLIYGRNEAGKTTLQRSILAALYGFLDNGSVTSAKKSAITFYEPWDKNAPYGIKLVFELDKGLQYRIERTFTSKARTVLYDLKSEKDVSNKFPSASHGRLFFSEELLGMPREVFESTSLVRQAELAPLEKSASAITDALLKLSASASQESTASQALEVLETILKVQVGTSRSRNKPLQEAQHRLEYLQSERIRLQEERQMLINKMHEIDQVNDGLQKLEQERDKAEYQRLSTQLILQKQRQQIIDDAEVEIERRKKTILLYEPWRKFRSDSQLKIQKLIAQHEKLHGDFRQAEQVAHHAQQYLLDLCSQINNLRKELGYPPSKYLPDLEQQSARAVRSSFQNWLIEEFSMLDNAIQEKKKLLELKTQKINGLSQIGHEGIAKDRQALNKLQYDLIQAKQNLDQLQKSVSQSGLPEDQWDTMLSNAYSNVKQWQNWKNYPAHIRDELLQLTAQHTHLSQNLAAQYQQISEVDNKFTEVETQIIKLQAQITDLDGVRHIPHQEKTRIQEIASQLDNEERLVAESRQQFEEIDRAYKSEQQAFEAEGLEIDSLEQMGMSGVSQLQQHWLIFSQQLASAKSRLSQAKVEWSKVGMPVEEFQRLENTVKEIQSGLRPPPKPKRGCRTLFMPKQSSVPDQTPTEIVTYSQIRPIYEYFINQQGEVLKNESALNQLETDLRQKLGTLVPDIIKEDFFTFLLQKLQLHYQKSSQIEKIKVAWNTQQTQFDQSRERARKNYSRLEDELRGFGFTAQNAIDQFLNACEQKERLIALEAELDHLQTTSVILKQQQEQYNRQRESVNLLETRIISLLKEAKIQTEFASIQDAIQQFQDGLENHRRWQNAQSSLEQIQERIESARLRLSLSRSEISSSEETLFEFSQAIIKKYAGLIQESFSDKDLEQLDADLQSCHSAQAEIDKVHGQFDRIQLQAKNIERDLNDWVEKEESIKELESDILKNIRESGVEIGENTLSEALIRFQEASQGYTNWIQAQREYESAVREQQTVLGSFSKMEIDINAIEAKLAEWNTQHPDWKIANNKYKPEVYEQTSQKIINQILHERDRLLRLRDEVDRNSRKLRQPAEIDEEIALVSAEVKQLLLFGELLELATSELTFATQEFQKIFAPRLEQIVDIGLKQITNERYYRVEIDPNSLNVRVLAPERNELVETGYLSTGTRDLVYLILRMGIAQLMSASGEKLPLLLDDPFVEFDAIRQQSALEYLKTMSGQTQILLFSKDDDIKEWFNGADFSKSDCKFIELT